MQKSVAKGFTLIEILIVLAIIGVMSAVIALRVGSPSQSIFKSELFKIANLFETLADEAVYTNSVITCEVENGIVCKSYRNGEWNDFNLAKVASWKWPNNIKVLQIIVNGIPLKPGESIRFSANGDTSAMSFYVTDGVSKAWIDSDLTGEFKVHY